MRKIILFIFSVLLLTSCEKFLDVTPEDKGYDNELLTDRSGFETVLAGVYKSLNSDTLYSLQMKYGFLETLVGSYNSLGSSHYYYRSYRHEYTYEEPKKIIEGIWTNLYKVINQTNIILKKVDNIKEDPYYNIVKGEAIGLRAFSHFQLLKLFGPVISQEGISAQSILYRDEVSTTASKFETAEQIRIKIERDLKESLALLENDPIRKNSRTANLNQFNYEKYNSLIDRRGNRMNYYAIKTMQSQLAQWFGDHNQAGKIAEEIIDELNVNKSIALAVPSALSRSTNIRMPMENIFGLLDQNLQSKVSRYLPRLEDTRSSSSSPLLFPNYTWLKNNLYTIAGHGSTNDFRYVNWFKLSANSTSTYKISKYIIPLEAKMSNDNELEYFENKILSLHQVYMIAAESLIETNPQKAIDLLNIVRNARDIGVTSNIQYDAGMTKETIANYLFDEIRKENIGEGILFTEYKRLYKNIHRATPVVASLNVFKFPIPDDELLYNPQN